MTAQNHSTFDLRLECQGIEDLVVTPTRTSTVTAEYILLDVEPFPCNGAKCADIPGPFLGNGSVNTFRQQRIDTQQKRYSWKRGVSTWSVPRSYKEDHSSSVRVCVKRGLVRVKLKNLNC
jgi:hypothetical protein